MAPDAITSVSAHEPTEPFWWRTLALGLVALAGALCLALPFWGDQALFTVYGRQLTHGAVLYRDMFDVKQPGIFLFYALGGVLFGFTEVGIHLFELAYWLAFSAFTLVALRPYFSRLVAPMVPICTVVVYYLYAGLLDLTQVEILVAFPLLVAWWLLDQASPGTRQGYQRYLAAGLAAAAVVFLKHLYLLIILAFLGYVVRRARRRGIPLADIVWSVGAFLLALLLPLLMGVAYFAVHGQLGRIWWAYFELGPTAQLLTPNPLSYLTVGARRFMIGHAPTAILAVLGCVHTLRQRAEPRLSLVAGMMLWCAMGAIAFFLLQSWPEYKWPLFTVPLGILAVVGIEALLLIAAHSGRYARRLALFAGTTLGIFSFIVGAGAPRVQTRLLVSAVIGIGAAIAAGLLGARRSSTPSMLVIVVAALGATVGLAAIAPVRKIQLLAEGDFALTRAARTEFQRSLNYSYRAADQDLETLSRGEGLPRSLYVFGDPVLLLRANRPQAVAILGWGPKVLDEKAWRELDSELRSTLPQYIVVDRYIESVIRGRYPAIMHSIESRYRIAFIGASGTWYVVRTTNSRHD